MPWTLPEEQSSLSMSTKKQRHGLGTVVEGSLVLSCVFRQYDPQVPDEQQEGEKHFYFLKGSAIFVVESENKNTWCMMKLKRSYHHKAIITTGQKSVCLSVREVTFPHGSRKLSLRSHIQDHLLNSST